LNKKSELIVDANLNKLIDNQVKMLIGRPGYELSLTSQELKSMEDQWKEPNTNILTNVAYTKKSYHPTFNELLRISYN
jgi:hypothetical protein